jgi:hypothetical protein
VAALSGGGHVPPPVHHQHQHHAGSAADTYAAPGAGRAAAGRGPARWARNPYVAACAGIALLIIAVTLLFVLY